MISISAPFHRIGFIWQILIWAVVGVVIEYALFWVVVFTIWELQNLFGYRHPLLGADITIFMFFGMPILVNVVLGWVFGFFRTGTPWSRMALVVLLSAILPVVEFAVLGIVECAVNAAHGGCL